VLFVKIEDVVLQGRYVRREPLEFSHVEGLVTASAVDPSLCRWSPIPQGTNKALKYVETALAMKWSSVPRASGISSNPLHGRIAPDACESRVAGCKGKTEKDGWLISGH